MSQSGRHRNEVKKKKKKERRRTSLAIYPDANVSII